MEQPSQAKVKCSKEGESCQKTGCCLTPGTACHKKDDFVAICMRGCTPGIHPADPEEYRTPWNCSILTWGCSDAWQPCEGAEGQEENIVPCCQWGCICNYTTKFFHQCLPPEGQPHCSKDGPQKKPSFADEPEGAEGGSASDSKPSVDDDALMYEGEEVADAKSAYKKNCYEIEGRWIGPDCHEEKLEVYSWNTLYTVATDSRGPWFLAGTIGAGVLSISTVMVWRRRCRGQYRVYRGQMKLLLPVDPTSFEPAE